MMMMMMTVMGMQLEHTQNGTSISIKKMNKSEQNLPNNNNNNNNKPTVSQNI